MSVVGVKLKTVRAAALQMSVVVQMNSVVRICAVIAIVSLLTAKNNFVVNV